MGKCLSEKNLLLENEWSLSHGMGMARLTARRGVLENRQQPTLDQAKKYVEHIYADKERKDADNG